MNEPERSMYSNPEFELVPMSGNTRYGVRISKWLSEQGLHMGPDYFWSQLGDTETINFFIRKHESIEQIKLAMILKFK